MFRELDEPYVKLMLDLSRENLKGTERELRLRLASADKQTLFELCLAHELHGAVASHILELELCELPDYWLKAYLMERDRMTFFRDKSVEICEIMYNHGIIMCVLKNGGIMNDMIGDPAACPMEDIDTLVRKTDFIRAHRILVENGFTFRFRSESEAEDLKRAYGNGSTEYYMVTPWGGKIWFELAWRAIAGRWIRPDLEPDTDELLSRAYFAPNKRVAILSPEDNLLQVCIHTAKHSYVRPPGLRLHLDVERIVAHKEIDWDLFVRKVSLTHVKTAVYFSLYLPRLLFGTPVPDYVLKAIRPHQTVEARILRILDSVGLLYPHPPKFRNRFAFLRFQTSLYDRMSDMLRVIYPSGARLREMYGYSCSALTPYYLFVRLADLIGIRKGRRD